ncbi:hypothetical protein HY409_00365 [Candidatus Gottesmanbacteria bacterium]|nr:hypothetical protein [Candidatus Gottesmanbacteria bacterium]
MPYIRCSFPEELYKELRLEAKTRKVRIVDVLHAYVRRGLAQERKKNGFILAQDYLRKKN